jgi:hypothetical protein
VGDKHVKHGACGVVELRPVLDAERLWHIDLHRLDVLAVPARGGRAVGESQHVQILGGFLSQEMVDPVHLLLVKHRMHDPVKLAETLSRGAERLLVDGAGTSGESMLAHGPRQPGERHRRNGQVVNEPQIPAQRRTGLTKHVEQGAGVIGAEPAAGEEQPPGEGIPELLLQPGAEFCERVVHMSTEVLMGDMAAAVADKQPLPGHESLAREPVEGGQHQPLGQVPSRPEKHEHNRSRIAGRLILGWVTHAHLLCRRHGLTQPC